MFRWLYLPKWGLDFIRGVLWRKLHMGIQMKILGVKLCPLDAKVEDHSHVLKHCYFSALQKAFGLA